MRTPEYIYCSEDSMFYESPDRAMVSSDRYSQEYGTELPSGWHHSTHGIWRYTYGPESLPDQGWKIHVSAVPETASSVLEALNVSCTQARASFKHLRSDRILIDSLAKYGDRVQCGKFATIYTTNDAQLHGLLNSLEGALSHLDGPYVLTDARWASGPIFFRYGAFRHMQAVDHQGMPVPGIIDDKGHLVPDLREPQFTIPPFIEPPDFLQDAINSRLNGDSDQAFPFHVRSALHFSNSGGVYLASPLKAPEMSVVLKEARPFVGLDRSGLYARDRLEIEKASLDKLASVEGIVSATGTFDTHGHLFLIEEHLPGSTLMDWVGANFPFSPSTPPENYTTRAISIARSLIDTIKAAHHLGVCLIDVQPKNVIIDDDDIPHLIDLETSVPTSRPFQLLIGTPGFAAHGNSDPVRQDWYACSRTIAELFWPIVPMNSLSETVLPMQRALADDELHLDGALERLFSTIPSFPDSPHPIAELVVVGTIDDEDLDQTLTRSMQGGIECSSRDQDGIIEFPGDIERFEPGGSLSVQAGVAGVLSAMDRRSYLYDGSLQQLIHASTQPSQQRPRGYLYGTLGALAVAVEHSRQVRHDLPRIRDGLSPVAPSESCDISMRTGLAGEILARASIAIMTRERILDPEITAGLDHLSDLFGSETEIVSPRSTSASAQGLYDGWTGGSLALAAGESLFPGKGYGELARAAILRDVNALTLAPDDTLQVLDGTRMLPYLGEGSAGIAFALSLFPRTLASSVGRDSVLAMLRACDVRCCVFGGLTLGRAGLVAALTQSTRLLGINDPLATSARRQAMSLGQYMFEPESGGDPVLAGQGGLKLSVDFGTGNAGVVHAARLLRDPSRPWALFPGLAALGSLSG